MDHTDHLAQIVLMLGAAVFIVALLRRAHISAVLGYLVAGLLIGPYGLKLVRDAESIHVMAELGVVFLLFVIGLELSFERLTRIRGRILSFGLLQMPITAAALGGAAWAAGQSPAVSLLIGGGLALSSTAIVLELLSESGEKATQTGRLSFATLIMQDLGVIPLMVLVPLLQSNGSIVQALGEASLKALCGILAIILLGRVALRPFFRATATHGQHELFTAAALLVVLGLAWVSSLAGLSPGLGAFMGGLLVAETEFRHQAEADILPFKGVLLGLFFVTVGMGIDLPHVLADPITLLGFTLTLILVKAGIMLALLLLLKFPAATASHAALLLSQGGEFAFVLFALADQHGLLPADLHQMLVSAVALSMAITPLLHTLGRRLGHLAARKSPAHVPTAAASVRETMDLRGHVVIVGFGRVGRVVGQLLDAERITYVALDMNAADVGAMRALGKRVYYGDAGRSVVLKAIGLPRAQAVIISHSDTRAALQAINAIRRLSPNIPIIARARNIEQVLDLEKAGATLALAEMFETSLQMGGALLRQAGIADNEIHRILATFRAGDYALARRAEGETPAAPDTAGDFAI